MHARLQTPCHTRSTMQRLLIRNHHRWANAGCLPHSQVVCRRAGPTHVDAPCTGAAHCRRATRVRRSGHNVAAPVCRDGAQCSQRAANARPRRVGRTPLALRTAAAASAIAHALRRAQCSTCPWRVAASKALPPTPNSARIHPSCLSHATKAPGRFSNSTLHIAQHTSPLTHWPTQHAA